MCIKGSYEVERVPIAMLYFNNYVTILFFFLSFFYSLSFSPKGERFCSFPSGGRLGWGFI
jgi:hypothetical protein